MKNNKILFIAPLPPPIHGSSMVSQYIKDSKLITDAFKCDFINLSTSRRMEEIGKRNIKKILRFITSYFILLLKLLTHRYDLCYLAITCHGIGFLKDAPFVLLCKLFQSKVVIHQHNKGMSNCVNRWPYRYLLPLVYHKTKVILLSWFLYDDISKVVKREQVMICPNGIPEIENPKSNINAMPNLLFLSNLIESKGIYVLLDACEILKEKGYRFICHVVGGETKSINRCIFESEIRKRNLEELVVYHGAKYGTEKIAYLNKADIFVQPTYEDCFPLTIVEAMAYGKPVVSTTEGAVPDLVKNGVNGYVCERKNPKSLAAALEKLLENETLRRNMGKEGYERYRNLYTLNVFENNMCEILKSLVS